MYKILYLGPKRGTSLQRSNALNRCGYLVEHFSIHDELPAHWAKWLFHFGGMGLDHIAANAIQSFIGSKSYDVIIVDNGDVIGPKSIRTLKKFARRIVNYNADNPYIFPSPEKKRWTILRQVISEYDLTVAIRRPGLEILMKKLGVKNPMLIWQTADELIHRRPESIDPQWASEVCFVGTWMPGRGKFIKALRDAGIPIRVYGPRWHKSTVYHSIQDCVHIGHLEGEHYSCALAGSKIGIVMLNQKNDDLHTKRSIEIPALEVAMCAVDTPYHRELYEEGTEAVFYKNAHDCAAHCLDLLNNNDKRQHIAERGHERCLRNGTWNERLMKMIVETAIAC